MGKIAVTLISVIILTGCNLNNLSRSGAINANNTDRSTIEKTVKSFYSNEVPKDEKFLSQYFLNSEKADIKYTKQILKAYNVKNIEIIKLYNIKQHNNTAIITCAYNTYFQGITEPRPSIEIVALINKNGSWYIVNDYSQVNDDDMKWLNEVAASEREQTTKTKEIGNLLNKTDSFNRENADFLEKGKEALTKIENINN